MLKNLHLVTLFCCQNYELVETEEIPNLEDSTFSPQVVKDIAQNVLSFLKSNATQEGHTYWLFKGKNVQFMLSKISTCINQNEEILHTSPFYAHGCLLCLLKYFVKSRNKNVKLSNITWLCLLWKILELE